MTTITTAHVMALVADTRRMMKRVSDVLDQAPAMGPEPQCELFSPLGHINDAMHDHIEALEALAAKLRSQP